MHDLKNELEETCSAYRNRKADAIALQTELNSANENIINMIRMIEDLKNLQIQDQRSTDGLSASTEIISHVSQEIAINNGLDPTGFECRLDAIQSGVTVESLELLINEKAIELESLQSQNNRFKDDMHDLKNELEETRSAYRNRKADVIALQTELNSANENIGNMTRVMNENSTLLERFEIQVTETEAEFSSVKVAADNMSNYVAELENKIDSQQISINVFRIENEELRRSNGELIAWEDLYVKGEQERSIITDKNLLIEAQSDILRQNIQMMLFEKQEIEMKMQQLSSEGNDAEAIRMTDLIQNLQNDLETMRNEKDIELTVKEAKESLFRDNQELIECSNTFALKYSAKEEEMELLISANAILIEAEKEKSIACTIVYEERLKEQKEREEQYVTQIKLLLGQVSELTKQVDSNGSVDINAAIAAQQDDNRRLSIEAERLLNELQQKDSTLRTATTALQKRDGEAAGIHASLESLEEELNILRNENDVINRKSKEDKNKSRELEKEIVSLGVALEIVKGEGEAMKVSIKDLALVPILSSNVEGASKPAANGYKDSDTCILALKEILTWLQLKKRSLNTDNTFLSPIKKSNDGFTIHSGYGGSSSNNSGSKMNYSGSMVGNSIGEESIRELISRVKEVLEKVIGDIEKKITTQQAQLSIMPLLTMTTPNRHDGAVALVNTAVNNPGSAAGKEVSRLLIEVKKERRKYADIEEQHTDLLGLLAQQEKELDVFRSSLKSQGGEAAVEMAENKAKLASIDSYGSYINFRKLLGHS